MYLNIGAIHTDEEIVVKLFALIGDCKEVHDINKLQREYPNRIIGIHHKIESMYALAMELEREISPPADVTN